MSEKKRSWFKRKAPTTGPKQDASGVSSNIRGSPAVAAGGDPGKASFETREFSLMVHGVDFSDLDLVINPEYFPEVKPQDILEISVQGTTALGAIMRVKSVAPVKGNLSISLSASMAELFRLHRGAVVTVKFADPATVGLHRATVSFKDYMPRSEMWRLKAEAIGRCLYHGKTLSLANVNVHVKDLIGATGDVLCGLVTDATKLVFRSKSAHVTVLLQLSSEMWDFADDGDLHMERVCFLCFFSYHQPASESVSSRLPRL
jgi:DEP domain-containing protein 5